MMESPNAFIVFEEKILPTVKTAISKQGATIEVFESDKEGDNINIFELTDSIGSRNKDKIFLKIEEARQQNQKAEDVVKLVEWYVRVVLTAKESLSASQAGLKPFLYSKSKEASALFEKSELQELLENLNRIVIKSRTKDAPNLWNLLTNILIKI